MLSHSPLGVGIAVLHIEWITLRHYIDSVRDNQELDPQFKSLLKHHWLEESQHTKLDTLIVEEMAASATRRKKSTWRSRNMARSAPSSTKVSSSSQNWNFDAFEECDRRRKLFKT